MQVFHFLSYIIGGRFSEIKIANYLRQKKRRSFILNFAVWARIQPETFLSLAQLVTPDQISNLYWSSVNLYRAVPYHQKSFQTFFFVYSQLCSVFVILLRHRSCSVCMSFVRQATTTGRLLGPKVRNNIKCLSQGHSDMLPHRE